MSAIALSNSEAGSRDSNPDNVAVRLQNVGKAYKIFESKLDNFGDALGLQNFMPWYRPKHFEFWALRGISLELAKGHRIGIVGRNGAGKTTLLKLITGNLTPTTGVLRVNGKVQALIDAGTGFHPDFTGNENIRASLTLQGFNERQIRASTEEIADFTELGDFLDRPFKTYSSGMAARLVFATATAVRPEILIIDEILGAGDGYFLGKSNERMRQLVGSGASILLVSHSMEQITLICDQTIWLDRGRVVKSGPSLDVVTAYSQYIRVLEDRRQRARNHKAVTRRHLSNDLKESFSDTVLLRFVAPDGGRLDVSCARLLREGAMEEECVVGDAQDAQPTHPAFVVVSSGGWSRPVIVDGRFYRSLGSDGAQAAGEVAFNLFALYPNLNYSVEVVYRSTKPAMLEVSVAGVTCDRFELRPQQEFQGARFELAGLSGTERRPDRRPELPVDSKQGPAALDPVVAAADATEATETAPSPALRGPTRWPGEGSLLIDKVELIGDDGGEHAVYERGSPMRLCMTIRAAKKGSYPLTPVAVLYRSDGIKVFAHIGDALTLEMEAGEMRRLDLDLGTLNLGDGHYAFAVAIYRELQSTGNSTWYDLIDRDYRFEVVGAPAFMGLFEHSGRWSIL